MQQKTSSQSGRAKFIHHTAIAESNQIGEGTNLWAFSHVMKDVVIGANCNIGEHCFIESGVVIGDAVTVKNGNMLWRGVKLEDGVFVGPNVSFTNDRFPRSPRLAQASARYQNEDWCLPTIVAQGASIGAGAVILPGITIGVFAMVGAGAVVTRDVPPHALVYGNPARVMAFVCQCGLPLHFQQQQARCCHCGLSYRKQDSCVHLKSQIVETDSEV